MLLVFSFRLLAIVSLSSDVVLLVFSFTLRAIAYTLLCVFHSVLLSFDFLKSSDVVVLVFSFIHALLLWFSSVFSLSAHVSVFRCWFKHHCVSYLQ